MTNEEIKKLQAENTALKEEITRLKNEMMRLISHNLDLAQHLEEDVELRLRASVAREIMKVNIERQRNADLQDDGQLLALIDIRLEQEGHHLNPDFNSAAMAKLMGVSQERLNHLFRHMALYRTADAYIDNLRVQASMRMLREYPQYTIAVVAEESGFSNVRTLQRRFQDALGMTPVEYRLMLTRDLD